MRILIIRGAFLTFVMLLLMNFDDSTIPSPASSIVDSLLKDGIIALIICACCWSRIDISGYNGSFISEYKCIIFPNNFKDVIRRVTKFEVDEVNAIRTNSLIFFDNNSFNLSSNSQNVNSLFNISITNNLNFQLT